MVPFRLKMKNDYGAAFDLLQHCLTINPNASSALYEISQYYMYLKQVPQGQAALEKAVENDPDNYWYSQGLASLYQQQNEMQKATNLLESMATRFSDRMDPLYSLLDIYNRLEEYDNVITTLNRLEEKMGKNEQLSMEKFRIYLQKKDNQRALSYSVKGYPVVARRVLSVQFVRNKRPMNTSPWHYPVRRQALSCICYRLRPSYRSAYKHHPVSPDIAYPSDTLPPDSLSHGKRSDYPSSE